MKEITEYEPGTFCWVELATADAEAAKKFYSALFNWNPVDLPIGPDMTYTLLKIDGKDVAALYPQDQTQKSQGIPPNWLSYVSVQKVEDALEKAKSLGGSVLAGPMDVFDLGRLGVLQDPTGATFAVWQPLKHIGASYANEPRTFCWNELYTTDDMKAGDFYSKLFGWGKEVLPMGDTPYTIFINENRRAAGMLRITKEMGNMPPNWLVYFAVEDCDRDAKRAKDLGATIMLPPQDIPNIGRFAILQDPQGAGFAIIKLINPQT